MEARLLGTLPKRSWLKRLRRLGLEVLIPLGRTASRPARGWGGVQERGGQPGAGRRWRGCHGKRGFIFPILHGLPFPCPQVPASPRLGPIVLQRRLLGDKLPRDIFVEDAADQGVIGDALPGGTV